MAIQRKSIALRQNQDQATGGKTLPLKAGAQVYSMDLVKADVEKCGDTVTEGEANKNANGATVSAFLARRVGGWGWLQGLKSCPQSREC
ncbi:MAG: xylan 1,4-beta-xylosidase [Polaromonas sp.]|nr:xylan 1,4-beta-xylosidase [Polaromonas sp.]